MCAFHNQRQTGILFERQGGERISCVPFTIHDKGIVFLKGERMGQGVCVSLRIKWCASELKTQKFRNESGAVMLKG